MELAMIESLTDVREALARQPGGWAWVGQRESDARALRDLAPFGAAFVCDSGEDLGARWPAGVCFSVERARGARRCWGNRHLEELWRGEEQPGIRRYFDFCRPPLHVVCYRSLAALEDDPRCRVLAPPLALKERFDDKLYQLELFQRLGVRTPRALAADRDALDFQALSEHLGGPFVVQAPIGSSGDTTWIIHTAAQLEAARAACRSPRVKLSAYRPLASLNVHGVTLRHHGALRVLQAAPSVQIVGVPSCTSRTETYCGNDYGALQDVSDAALQEIRRGTEAVGLAMGEAGYLGVFGMDFLLDGDQALALEVNPRFQGSTELLSRLQLMRGEIPLAALQLLQHLDLVDQVPADVLDGLSAAWARPYAAAHLIVHHLGAGPIRAASGLRPGVHVLAHDEARRLRGGEAVDRLAPRGEWLVLDNLPAPGARVDPDARLAMLETRDRVTSPDLRGLLPAADAFVAAVRRQGAALPEEEILHDHAAP
jgi:hypothetical protein